MTRANDRGTANHLCIKPLLHVRRHARLYYRCLPPRANPSPPVPIPHPPLAHLAGPSVPAPNISTFTFIWRSVLGGGAGRRQASRARCEECGCLQRVWERAKRCGTAAVIWPGSHQLHHHAPPHVARTLPLHARSHTHGAALSHAGPSPPTPASGAMLAPHAHTWPQYRALTAHVARGGRPCTGRVPTPARRLRTLARPSPAPRPAARPLL